MNGISFTLNGQRVTVEGADPHTSLLQYLRSVGLTGAKEGCAEGECGACSVVMVREGPDGSARYVVVNSCLLLLPLAADQEIWTVESLARSGELHPVQEALAQAGGSQCGYCTPGFVMSLFAEYYRPDRAEFDPEALSGNLCRCTGYRPIRDAARSLGAPAAGDAFLERLAQPAPEVERLMYEDRPRPTGADSTRLFRPTTLAELFALLQAEPQAQLVAGATDLGVEVNQRARRWPVLISLEAVPELRSVTHTADCVEMGAGLTLSELEERLGDRIPLLAELFPLFASRPVRNRATLGGNLATASPIGDAAPVLLALGAQVRMVSAAGERLVPLEQFFIGYRRTALAPGEVIAGVRVSLPLPQQSRFYKVAKRQRDDISTVAAAFAIDLGSDGRVARARLAYGGVAATPVRARGAEAALLGRRWDEEAVREAQAALAEEIRPLSDHRGSAGYRKAVAGSLLHKFFVEMQGVPVCDRA